MNPARFRNRIIIQKLIGRSDADGFSSRDATWVEVKKTWADIETLSGKEYFQASAVQEQRTSRFIIRYTIGISADMRILYKNRIFNIVEPPINDDERNITLTILAEEQMK
jgi:SPP1 family predicted phage head-tail adaptor